MILRLTQDSIEVRQARLEVVKRRLTLERRDLLAELGLHFRMPRELIDGEAQGLRGRLVAGDDEGGDLSKFSAPSQLCARQKKISHMFVELLLRDLSSAVRDH